MIEPERSAPASPPRPWKPVWVAIALILSLAHIRYLWFVCDDAFISFRYAANLAAGLGPVFNPGEKLEGYTNFLWMVLSALVLKVGGAPENVMPVISAACALATVAAVMFWAPQPANAPAPLKSRRTGPLGDTLPWAGFLLAGSAAFAAWATSGLETALFTMLVTLAYLACVRGQVILSGFALGLASLTRPEGLLISFLVLTYLGLRGAQLGLTRRGVLTGATVWAVFAAGHAVWRLWYYGQALPNTFAIKTPGFVAIASGAAYVAESVFRLHLYMLAIPVLALITARSGPSTPRTNTEREAWALLGAIVFPYFAYVMTTGGDFMPLFRFVTPMLPLIALAAGAAIDALARRLRLKNASYVLLGGLLVGAFAVLNLSSSRREQAPWTRGYIESIGLTRQNAANWARVGARLKKLSLPSDTLAITAAGVIPYVTKLYTIDLLGLTAPDLSRYRRRATTRPGHAYYLSGAALLERPPQFLLGHPEVRPTLEGLGLGLDFEPEWQAGVLEPYTLLGYRLPGDPQGFVAIAVRHDAVTRVEAAGRSGP